MVPIFQDAMHCKNKNMFLKIKETKGVWCYFLLQFTLQLKIKNKNECTICIYIHMYQVQQHWIKVVKSFSQNELQFATTFDRFLVIPIII